ncbi:MAG: radical SAM protein [Bryobacteraceae bacterium]|nr:radical SAM protein [Bryobacteraceae bacterium]
MGEKQSKPHTMVESGTGFLSRYAARYRDVARMNPPLKSPRAYSNWFRANWELLAGTSEVKARPLKLTFDPTNVCQLRCPLCPTGLQAQDRDKGHAQIHLLEHLLDEVGDHVFFMDFFNWGEPLLNPRIEDFIRIAHSKKIVTSLSTNLSLPLSDDRIRRLVGSGLNEIIVSLDGASAGTYATYRREGRFDLVIDNMRRIIQEKRRLGHSWPMMTWQYLVFRFNEHEIPLAQRMAEEMGVDRITFRAPFLDVDRFPLPQEDRVQIQGWQPKEPLFQIHSAPPESYAPKSRCGWHYMSSAINYDGTVAPCCTTFEKRDDFGTLGKTGERGYMEVFNNESFRAVRDRYAGRLKTPVALVCEKCPTPAIMDYHTFLNRQVILFTLVGIMEKVRGFFRGNKSSVPLSTPAPLVE